MLGLRPAEEKILHTLLDTYIFTWDSIPGTEDNRLKEFIAQELGETWIQKIPDFHKSDDGSKISASYGKKLLSIALDQDRTKATLENGDIVAAEFTVQNVDGRFRIHEKRDALSAGDIARRTKLSPRGYSEAIKDLEAKGLVVRSFGGKGNEKRHNSVFYRATDESEKQIFLNQVSAFVLSDETMKAQVGPGLAVSEAKSDLKTREFLKSPVNQDDYESIRRNLEEISRGFVSAWRKYVMQKLDKEDVASAERYEEALAKYLAHWSCNLVRYFPAGTPLLGGARLWNTYDALEYTSHMFERPLHWALKKYRVPESERELAADNFKSEEYKKLETQVYDEKGRQVYERCITALIPPSTLFILDIEFQKKIYEAYHKISDVIDSLQKAGGEETPGEIHGRPVLGWDEYVDSDGTIKTKQDENWAR